MPYRQDAFAAGCLYHVHNRGVNRSRIFAEPGNYVYLLRKVKDLVDELSISVVAYCLMPNHYHFVLRQEGEASISVFMQRLFQTYSQAFNKQQRRTGPLFEGRFRHVLVARDEYAVHLCRYVHVNPVAAGLVPVPGEWPYSNYLEWIGERRGTLVDRRFVRQYFATPAEYESFVLGELSAAMAQEIRPYLLDEGVGQDRPESSQLSGRSVREE
jgi:putative transposase